MCRQILDRPSTHGQPLAGVSLQEGTDKVAHFAGTRDWKRHLVDALDDLGVDHHGVLADKWRITSHQLEDEDAERPPIQSLCMAQAVQQLWCEVVWCTTRGEGLLNHEFGQSQVRQLRQALRVEEQVLWLQIHASLM